MAVGIAMPKLGMTMREGRVVSWPVAVGARVDKGQTILTIESEKAEVEVEAPASGVLRHIYVQPEATVPCGTLLAAITATADELFDASAFQRQNDRPDKPAPRRAEGVVAVTAPGGVPVGGGRVTPAARALARKLGIDPSAIPGSGPAGRVLKEDVEALAARQKDLVEVAPGLSLEVPSHGQGDAVILLPGFGTDASALAPQAAVLAERFRVFAVNPRGVGLSSAPDEERYDIAAMAADAAAATNEPAHVIGASLGAAVGIEMALAHAERLRSLTLITPFVDVNARLSAVIDAWCRLAREAVPETLAHALLPWLFSPHLLADDAVRERTARGLATTVARVPAATLERNAAGMRAWSGSRRGELRFVGVPTLVIIAGDDLLTPGGDGVGAEIPGATTAVVAGSGHAVAIEAAQQVNEHIQQHVASVPS